MQLVCCLYYHSVLESSLESTGFIFVEDVGNTKSTYIQNTYDVLWDQWNHCFNHFRRWEVLNQRISSKNNINFGRKSLSTGKDISIH